MAKGGAINAIYVFRVTLSRPSLLLFSKPDAAMDVTVQKADCLFLLLTCVLKQCTSEAYGI